MWIYGGLYIVLLHTLVLLVTERTTIKLIMKIHSQYFLNYKYIIYDQRPFFYWYVLQILKLTNACNKFSSRIKQNPFVALSCTSVNVYMKFFYRCVQKSVHLDWAVLCAQSAARIARMTTPKSVIQDFSERRLLYPRFGNHDNQY